MKARMRESGGNTRELDGRAQERLADVLSVRRIVAAFAIRVLEVDGAIHPALIDEFRSHHTPGLHRLTLMVEDLVDDCETVTFAQVAVKIDVGREHVRELHRHRV
ncbi:hypothetical protein D3C83_36880 [compost metagenome]